MAGEQSALSGPAASEPQSFGRRLRDLRVQHRLSQVDLAGDELHPSYVSLLEAGKRRPTPDVLRLLADRLDSTVEYLQHGVDPEVTERITLAVRYAQLALKDGEPAQALRHVEELLESDLTLPADLASESHLLRAQAREGLGQLDAAIEDLEVLAAAAAAAGQWEVHMSRVIDLVRCYQEAGDVAYALDLATEALARIASLGLGGADVHAELVSTVVGAYYVRGDLVKAGQLAKGALAEVEARSSTRARGAVLWNASLVAEARGEVSDALLLAERALALYSEGGDARAIARLRVAYGWLLLRSAPPQPAEARGFLQAAHAVLQDVGSAIDIAYCETELARAAVLLGEAEEGLQLAETAAHRYEGITRLESASTALVRARALLALGRRDAAVDGYRAAAGILGELDVSRQAASAWRELADAFAQLDLLSDAAMAYQQALSEAGVPSAPDVTYQPSAEQARGAASSRTRRVT
jgi:transcriptional regulator with XRE-family HTH domain